MRAACSHAASVSGDVPIRRRAHPARIGNLSPPSLEAGRVRVPGATFAPPGQDRLPGVPEEFGADVFPFLPIDTRATIRTANGSSLTVRMTQIPVVPAYVVTVHKSQGVTLHRGVVGPLRPVGRGGQPDRQILYVAASRVGNSEHIQFTWTPTEEDFKYFAPPASLKDELERLQEKAQETKRKAMSQGLY